MSHRTNIKSDDTKNNMADNFSKETYALTNEQKERIYSTMIRKLNIEMTDSTKVITGVEKCPRNSIFRITATAVSAAALIAGIGINFTLMHNMNKSISEISVTDDSLTASEAASQSPREEMPLFIGSTAVNECATTAAVPAKTVSISVSESSITTSVQTAALTETTVTEPEASAETTESETAVVGSEAFNETAYRSEDDNNVPYSGSVVDDIDDLCNDDYFTNKSYRIEVRNTPKDQPSIKVNSISLRDDLGNIVAQKTLDNGSNGGY
ncbi:MAG: hypothetical protein IJ861_08270, partial [Clostridia bacterium]|nr:hypothetical protein [Clostridia bacterium]